MLDLHCLVDIYWYRHFCAKPLTQVIKNLASQIGFNRNEDVANVVKEVMALADSDANGVVDYYEFLPLAVDVVQVCIRSTSSFAHLAATSPALAVTSYYAPA